MSYESSLEEVIVPNRKQYNLDYRPHGYWGPQEVGTHIGARIKGELRRQVAVIEADAGYRDPVIAAESLSDDRKRLGNYRIDPKLSGLPISNFAVARLVEPALI